MPYAPQTRRRWYQFGLGTTLLLLTAFAIVAAFLAYHVHWIRQRRELIPLDMTTRSGPPRYVSPAEFGNPWFMWAVDPHDLRSDPTGTTLQRAPGLIPFFGEAGYGEVQLLFRNTSLTPPHLVDSELAVVERFKIMFPEAQVKARRAEHVSPVPND
jgi:hypothetical protein